jgi:biopolymer transport protein ExbD
MSYLSATRTKSFRRDFCHQPDMAPLADLAFLLVAFFMLSSYLVSRNEPGVDLPLIKSWPGCQMSRGNIAVVLISKEGKIFYNPESKGRKALLTGLTEKYGIHLSGQDTEVIAQLDYFGMDIRQLPAYLKSSPMERKRFVQPGIPVGEGNNQLADWLQYTKRIDPKVRFIIEGDESNAYPVIKQLLQTFQSNGVNRFSLLTNPDYQAATEHHSY